LIIVLWIAFGLVSLALYFAHAMSFELRAADQRVAGVEAEQAIAGAVRYVSNVLVTLPVPGTLPDLLSYEYEAVPVGDATFWLLGRDTNTWQTGPHRPVFGLLDESSRLNVNTTSAAMLEMLPGMTAELAAAIVDWRDSDSDVTPGGAEDETYQRRNPPYRCKNAKFESLDELRLVYGMDLTILYGEDANLNGVLDPNENDGDTSPPSDNRDGRLDPGILAYLTVCSREPNTRTNGEARINVGGTNQQALATLLQEKFGTDRANQILLQVGLSGSGPSSGGGQPSGGGQAPGGGQSTGGGQAPGGGTSTNRPSGATAVSFGSVLEFYIRSGLTPEEFAEVESDLTVTNATALEGLVNVNTASEAVLACLPGIGIDRAPMLVAYRQTHARSLNSVAWVQDALGEEAAIEAGPYLTAFGYQYLVDVAAVGHYGRGYRRVKFLLDTSEGTPRVVWRQDLTHLGWALGQDLGRELRLTLATRLNRPGFDRALSR
jgi:DNA uptake protein ComE-like DNA-binding protein